MNKSLMMTILAISTGSALSPCATAASSMEAKTKITFKGSSTLHDFEGTVASKPFDVVFHEGAGTGQMKVAAKASISILDMTTNNTKRDKNMFKMFDTDHFKQIEGELPETVLSETERTQATLHLKIHDVKRSVVATFFNVKHTDSQISCTMTFPVSLSDFSLKAPSVMGLIKVHDTVYVECRISGTIDSKALENKP